MRYTKKFIKQAIDEIAEAIKFNVGKRVSITSVDGLDNLIAQVKFHTRLSKANAKYVNTACNCGDILSIVDIGRIMNKLNCAFTTAAKLYHRNDQDVIKVFRLSS